MAASLADGPDYGQACPGRPDGPHAVCLGRPDDRDGLHAAYLDGPGDVLPEACRGGEDRCSNAAAVAVADDASRACWS